MKPISKQHLNSNPNTDYGLDGPVQDMLANGNAQFIIDIALEMRLGHSISSLALHVTNIFFHKKCYVNYDRFLILAAALLLTSKLRDVDSRLRQLCNAFHKVIVRQNAINLQAVHGRTGPNSESELYTEDKWKRLKDQIVIHQSEILRTLEYEMDFISPTEYIKKYCDLFYPDRPQLIKRLFYGTRVVVLDSYRTRVSLVYTPLVIFCACFLISCRYEKALPHETVIIRKIARERMEKSKEIGETGEIQSTLSPHSKNIQSVTPQLNLPAKQSPSKSEGVSPLSQPSKSQRICSEQPSKEYLYETWLDFISCEEGEKVTVANVRGCLEAINGLLRLWGEPGSNN